jgi:hypothetical protein
MAVENPSIVTSFVATAALTSYQYRLLKFVSGTDFGVTVATTTTEKPAGVLQNAPAILGAADSCVFGISKVKLGGTVAVGDKLTSMAAGAAIATVTNLNHYWGFALQAGDSGDIITMLVCPGMVSL